MRLWDLAAGRSARALLPEGGAEVNAVCMGRSGEMANWAFAAAASLLLGFYWYCNVFGNDLWTFDVGQLRQALTIHCQ